MAERLHGGFERGVARQQDADSLGIALLGGIWFAGGLVYRGYEALDVETSPRLRGLAQKYLFTYLLGHSPRY
ncbi:MAG: hypothetical protein ACHQ7M_21705, partial [Chloroflexota bacterium]